LSVRIAFCRCPVSVEKRCSLNANLRPLLHRPFFTPLRSVLPRYNLAAPSASYMTKCYFSPLMSSVTSSSLVIRRLFLSSSAPLRKSCQRIFLLGTCWRRLNSLFFVQDFLELPLPGHKFFPFFSSAMAFVFVARRPFFLFVTMSHARFTLTSPPLTVLRWFVRSQSRKRNSLPFLADFLFTPLSGKPPPVYLLVSSAICGPITVFFTRHLIQFDQFPVPSQMSKFLSMS